MESPEGMREVEATARLAGSYLGLQASFQQSKPAALSIIGNVHSWPGKERHADIAMYSSSQSCEADEASGTPRSRPVWNHTDNKWQSRISKLRCLSVRPIFLPWCCSEQPRVRRWAIPRHPPLSHSILRVSQEKSHRLTSQEGWLWEVYKGQSLFSPTPN